MLESWPSRPTHARQIVLRPLEQLVIYDVHITRKIKLIHAIFYHILLFYRHFIISYEHLQSATVQVLERRDNIRETCYTCTECIIRQLTTGTTELHCEAKKLHRFIFAIALSELHLLWQGLAHVYINKFSIIRLLYILYIIRDGEPA